MTTRIPKKHTKALADLLAFARQRPGFEPGNYATRADLLRDYRPVARDLQDVEGFASYFHDSAAFLACLSKILHGSDRLAYRGKRLEYCTGQYWCVEYRAAALEALRRAAWWYFRDFCQSKPAEEITGDDVRKAARLSLPRRLARIVCA